MRIRSAHGTTIASSTQNYADQAVNLSSEPCGKPRYRLHPTLDFCYGNRNMLAGTFGGRSMITITLLAAPLALTLVEFCSAAPEPPATELPEWHWRMVDGKKCYFRADKLLPRENLVWSYDAKQLDLDEGATVTGRRQYTPQELKAIATIERRMREDERPQPKRKKMRVRRRRDSNDVD